MTNGHWPVIPATSSSRDESYRSPAVVSANSSYNFPPIPRPTFEIDVSARIPRRQTYVRLSEIRRSSRRRSAHVRDRLSLSSSLIIEHRVQRLTDYRGSMHLHAHIYKHTRSFVLNRLVFTKSSFFFQLISMLSLGTRYRSFRKIFHLSNRFLSIARYLFHFEWCKIRSTTIQRSTTCLAIGRIYAARNSLIDVRELTGRTPQSAGAFIEEEREREAWCTHSDERADG